ncbi:hypothetical protein AD940_01425 [Gluconobacter thailandicus]|nr:hypothetical protein AD940_01425 [Gluconobacter thailandicus]
MKLFYSFCRLSLLLISFTRSRFAVWFRAFKAEDDHEGELEWNEFAKLSSKTRQSIIRIVAVSIVQRRTVSSFLLWFSRVHE